MLKVLTLERCDIIHRYREMKPRYIGPFRKNRPSNLQTRAFVRAPWSTPRVHVSSNKYDFPNDSLVIFNRGDSTRYRVSLYQLTIKPNQRQEVVFPLLKFAGILAEVLSLFGSEETICDSIIQNFLQTSFLRPTLTEFGDRIPLRVGDCDNPHFQTFSQTFTFYYSSREITIHRSLFIISLFIVFEASFRLRVDIQKFYYSRNTIHFRKNLSFTIHVNYVYGH